LITTFQAHTSYIYRIKQSPFNLDYVATCSQDSTVKIWQLHNWQLIRTYTGHTNWVYGLEFLNSDIISSSSLDNIKIWSISTGQTSRTINPSSYAFSLKLLNNGVHLAAGLGNYNIEIYNINTGSLITTLTGHTNRIRNLVLIGRGDNLLVSSSEDNSIRIWDLTTYTSKNILNGHTSPVVPLKVITWDLLASGDSAGTIIFWNITSGTRLRTLLGHTNSIYESLDLLSDNQTLVSGSRDLTIKYWNTQSGQNLRSINIGFEMWSMTVLRSARPSKELYLSLKKQQKR
jgi:WD40 repeat protein